MKDLTTTLETELAQAINKFRDAIEAAQAELHADIANAHQKYEVDAEHRIGEANEAMAKQIREFLGAAAPEPEVQAPIVDIPSEINPYAGVHPNG